MHKVQATFERVKRKYGISGRPFTFRDFHRICRGENIRVEHCTVISTAYIFTMREYDYRVIVLGRSLRGRNRLFAMFHELGHHFLGHQGRRLRSIGRRGKAVRSKRELDADSFAELATGIKTSDRV
jgi:Zn-dependent peptidase ImmA (M78 family)